MSTARPCVIRSRTVLSLQMHPPDVESPGCAHVADWIRRNAVINAIYYRAVLALTDARNRLIN